VGDFVRDTLPFFLGMLNGTRRNWDLSKINPQASGKLTYAAGASPYIPYISGPACHAIPSNIIHLLVKGVTEIAVGRGDSQQETAILGICCGVAGVVCLLLLALSLTIHPGWNGWWVDLPLPHTAV